MLPEQHVIFDLLTNLYHCRWFAPWPSAASIGSMKLNSVQWATIVSSCDMIARPVHVEEAQAQIYGNGDAVKMIRTTKCQVRRGEVSYCCTV